MVACRYGIIIKLTLFFSGQLQPYAGFAATYANPGKKEEGPNFLTTSNINIIDIFLSK